MTQPVSMSTPVSTPGVGETSVNEPSAGLQPSVSVSFTLLSTPGIMISNVAQGGLAVQPNAPEVSVGEPDIPTGTVDLG